MTIARESGTRGHPASCTLGVFVDLEFRYSCSMTTSVGKTWTCHAGEPPIVATTDTLGRRPTDSVVHDTLRVGAEQWDYGTKKLQSSGTR